MLVYIPNDSVVLRIRDFNNDELFMIINKDLITTKGDIIEGWETNIMSLKKVEHIENYIKEFFIEEVRQPSWKGYNLEISIQGEREIEVLWERKLCTEFMEDIEEFDMVVNKTIKIVKDTLKI